MNFLKDSFLDIFNMSITTSYVIIAVLIIRLLLKRAPKKFSYILWSVVGFRLICPISFSSILSIFNILNNNQKNDNRAMNYLPSYVRDMKLS